MGTRFHRRRLFRQTHRRRGGDRRDPGLRRHRRRPLASQILSAMEAAASRATGTYSHYGSSVYKQLYIYGRLDTGPTELVRDYGFAWGVGGWLLTPFLKNIGPEGVRRLRQRVADELKTTFASHYAAEIGLAEALDPKVVAVYARRATGAKYLINPQKGLS